MVSCRPAPAMASRSVVWIGRLLVCASILVPVAVVPREAAAIALPAIAPEGDAPGGTFYVSPAGADDGPGTERRPWKSFAKAASTLRAGQTAIFENGTYVETRAGRFAHSGTAAAPIVVRARHQHRAVLVYRGLADRDKVVVSGQRYVTIRGFEITQDAWGTTWADKLVQCWNGADHCKVLGNKIHGSMENFKTWNSADVLVQGNVLYDTHIGAGSFNAVRPVFERNHVFGFDMDGIQTKGGTRGARVANNHVRTDQSANAGISLGGSSCGSTSTATCGNFDPAGYEGYGGVAYNNIVVSQVVGALPLGLLIQGCDGCAFLNNVVVGTQNGLATRKGPGRATGWSWDVLTRNPRFQNNIVVDCQYQATQFRDVQGTLTHDHNLYHGCWEQPAEKGGVYAAPLFVDPTSDWRLRPNSPARGAGVAVSFTRLAGTTVDVSRDRTGEKRTVPWNMGAY